jgi:hypothetical protein
MKFIFFFCLCSRFIFAETIEEKHILLSGFIFFATLLVFIIYKIVQIAYSNFKFNLNRPKIELNEDCEHPYLNENHNKNEESEDLRQSFELFIQEKLNNEKSISKNFDSENDSEFRENEKLDH